MDDDHASGRVGRGPVRPAADPPRRRRRIAVRRATAATLVAGLAITVATTALTRHAVGRTEQAVNEQRHAALQMLMRSMTNEILVPLKLGAVTARATGGDPADFSRTLTPVFAQNREFVGLAVVQVDGPSGPPRVLLRAGRELAAERDLQALASLPERTSGGQVGVVDQRHSPLGRRMGFALSGPAPGPVVYGELELPPMGTTMRPTEGTFAQLDYTLFLGASARPELVINSTSAAGPIPDPLVTGTFRYGSSDFTVTMTPRSPQTGRLTMSLPWLVLATGLLMVASGSLAIELIGRRGDTAVRLGHDLSARSTELERAEHRFRSLVEQMPAVTYVLDTDEHVVRYMSPQIEHLAGTPPADWEAGRAGWPDRVHPDDREGLPAWDVADFSSASSLSREYRLVRADGEVVWVHEVAVELPAGPGEHRTVQAVMSDITELKRAQRALSDERDVSEALMDSLPGVFLFYDTQDHFRRWNRNFEMITGYSGDEIAQLGARDLFADGDRDLVTRRIREAFERGEATAEAELVAKDGTARPFFFSGQRVALPEGPCLVGVGIDVTERRRAEREINELNATLEQRVHERTAELTAANRELDSFTYAVSHDLRVPLRAIDGFSRALLEDAGDALDETGRHHLERVRNATARMDELIDDLLELSQVMRADMCRERVDLSELARAVAGELHDRDRDRRVEVVIHDGIEARGDRRLLRIALENLLGNAWKFSAGEAAARIEFRARDRDGTTVYTVEDNGAGFDAAYADRLFEPFQRLHPSREFEGSGIGLATVARIVRRHGGRVWAEGAVGSGARISFTCDEPRERGS